MSVRRLLCVAVLLLAAVAPALGQNGISWTHTYTEVTNNTNFGFNHSTLGAVRQASTMAATNYLTSVLDGRGAVTINWNNSLDIAPSGGYVLASFGAATSSGFTPNGYYFGAPVYERARSGTSYTANPSGSGQVNFHENVPWHYDVAGGGTTLSNGTIDLVSVLIHEVGHGLGFASGVNDHTTGRGGNPGTVTPGTTPDWFNTWDRWLQRGNGAYADNAIFRTDVTNSNYGTVNTARINAFTGGNDQSTTYNSSTQTFTTTVTNNTSTGLYFGGTFAREVFGGAIPVYSPSPFEGGSSLSHVNVSPNVSGGGGGAGPIGLMNPSIHQNSIRRFQAYEIAMLMDMGWNVYNWTSSSGAGNWGDGLNGPLNAPTSYTLTNSKWRTDSGIVLSANASASYNTFNAQGLAPILPVNGETTANNVLNFSNTTTSAYISTNNLPYDVRLSRLTFASSNATGGITISGGSLNFGLNADGTASVLVPKIVQNGSGGVTISSAIQTNTIATQDQIVSGRVVATFQGHTGITVEGTGTGAVTLGGNISGDGGITKNSSSFNLIMSGANTYTGTTTVNAGGLYVNGSLSSTANGVTVTGGTLGGTGTISRAITVNSGGTLEGGTSTTVGTLGVKAATTVNSGGNLRAELGAGTASDKLDMTGGTFALDLKNGSLLALSANGFTRTSTTYTLADLDAATAALLKVNGADVAADTTITTFTSTGGIGGTNTNGVGDIDLVLSGFSLSNGDRFILRRNTAGDLVLSFTPVPEPAGVLLLCGLAGVAAVGWRRWRASRAA